MVFFSFFGFQICRELLLCMFRETETERHRERSETSIEQKSEIESKSRVAIQLLVVNCDNAKDVFCIVVSDKWIFLFHFYSFLVIFRSEFVEGIYIYFIYIWCSVLISIQCITLCSSRERACEQATDRPTDYAKPNEKLPHCE